MARSVKKGPYIQDALHDESRRDELLEREEGHQDLGALEHDHP